MARQASPAFSESGNHPVFVLDLIFFDGLYSMPFQYLESRGQIIHISWSLLNEIENYAGDGLDDAISVSP